MKKIKLLLLLCICLSASIVFGQNKPSYRPAQVNNQPARIETLEQKIYRVAQAHRLDARLFFSLISAESSFKFKALSYKGAGCLTQLMPATARRFGLIVNAQYDERFSNLEKCLNAGAQYLAWLLATFRGDVRLALAGYNAGEGAVMKFGWRIPPFQETVQYVEKICALYYGQSGHGVAMAYNQPQAQIWVNAMYGARRRVMNTSAVQPSFPAQVNVSNVTNRENVSNVKVIEQKKPVVNRIVLEESSPRIRTQSLSFGNN